MGEVWVGWKSDDMEANIRTFPPSPPTNDIAVRFALLLCPDWVGEGGTASLPPPPPPSPSPLIPSPIPSPLFHLLPTPQTTRTPCSLAEYLFPGFQEEEDGS